ncbi:unnamed protein product, partial [Prorocentrum cordatum]
VTPLARGMWKFAPPPPGPASGVRTAAGTVARGAAFCWGREASMAASAWRLEATPNEQEAIERPDVVARYRSRDAATGRVWGMPSAFGRGQCLGCPAKCAPPSTRCQACQLVRARGAPMQADQLRALRLALDGAPLARQPDVARRLQGLYSKLQGGQIPEDAQAQLLRAAGAIGSGDAAAARRACAELSAEHWDQHKDWLRGLRCLASAR